MRQLLTLRRVFVDRFSGGETAAQMRDMIINGLQGSKLFTITENQEKADAILRGSGEDLVFNETHTSSDSLHEANAAVRLVSKDGDVIWSTTQESLGGKFRGASSDVADKITKQLTEDYERAKKLPH